jgi:hypothetical protein
LAPCNIARTGPLAATAVVAVAGLALGAVAVRFAVLVELDVVFDFELPQAAPPSISTTATGATIVCLSACFIPHSRQKILLAAPAQQSICFDPSDEYELPLA